MRLPRRRSTSGAALLAALALAGAGAAYGAAAEASEHDGAHRPGALQAQRAHLATTVTPKKPAAPKVCGTAAAGVLGRAAGVVATRIYAGELAGAETRGDQHQVESYGPLLSALAAGEGPAIESAVTALVYSHTHIVRLRVTRGSTVLADVGGPYILAPVYGALREGGRTIAHYTLSVQDDLGYVKLETRFLGVPLVLRAGSRQIPVEGEFAGAPASIPTQGPLTVNRVAYQAYSFKAAAFPSGPLRISIFVPLPARLSHMSCLTVRGTELGIVAERISRRFTLTPSSLSAYVKFTSTLTGGLLYIHSGARTLAGSTRTGPAKLPSSGQLKFHGHTYTVYSFDAQTSAGTVRIFHLSPP